MKGKSGAAVKGRSANNYHEPGRHIIEPNLESRGGAGARQVDNPFAVDRRPIYDAVKRGIDIFLAVSILVIGAPVWIALGLAVRMTSPGPAIFHRTAVGRGGKPYQIYKFRTMEHEATDKRHLDWLREYVLADRPFGLLHGRPIYKVFDDPRVTRLGAFLRRTSLDEVPQFLNVLKGEMSVVGPRPPIPDEFDLYNPFQRRRLAVRPGITGLYQVSARGAAPFSEVLAIDLDYIRRRSLRFDLKIMAMTPLIMLSGRGSGQEAPKDSQPAFQK